MRKLLTNRKVKWGVAIFCAVALVGGTLAWQLGGTGATPGGVVAEVDGTPIYADELDAQVEQQLMMMQMGGQQVDEQMQHMIRDQVLNNMIAIVLLNDEAERRDITIDREEVEDEYDTLVSQHFDGDEEALDDALAQQGMDSEDLIADIEDQLRVENLIDMHVEEYLESEEKDVSEEELRERYDMYAEQVDDLPPFEEMKPELEEEVLQEREQQGVDQLVSDLREESQIEIYQ